MRNRPLTSSFTMWSILLFLGSIAMGGGVFAVTQAAKQQESGIDDINRSILAERQSIRVLEAEWAYLSRPQRLEELMAMRQDLGDMPPAPAPIATMEPVAETAMVPVPETVQVEQTEPAAGVAVAEDVKPEPKAEPVKTAAVKIEAPAKPKAKKETKKPEAKIAKAPVTKKQNQTAKYDEAWSIKKRAAYRPSLPTYRATNISTRGGMRPIVE